MLRGGENAKAKENNILFLQTCKSPVVRRRGFDARGWLPVSESHPQGGRAGKGSDTVGWSHMLVVAPLAWRGQRQPLEAGTAVRRRHGQYFELLGGHRSGERLCLNPETPSTPFCQVQMLSSSWVWQYWFTLSVLCCYLIATSFMYKYPSE
jgi:hypothetical protein